MWSTRIAAARQLLLYACRVLIPGQAAFCLVQLISNNTQHDKSTNPANQALLERSNTLLFLQAQCGELRRARG